MLPDFAKAYTVRVNTTNPDVHIPGGTYAIPYDANQASTRYILDGDMSADSSGILIDASNIIIDLNGHTITYNQVSPGVGVGSGDWNRADIAIINGSIIQGAAMSEGVVGGGGSNPIRFRPGTPASYNSFRVQVAGVTVRYGSKDVGGIMLASDGHLVEECTIEDTYEYGTMADRHIGISAIGFSGANNVARNNTLINIRHRGIDLSSRGEAYGNTIGIRSIATNSIGITVGSDHQSVHHNIITGRGEHPIGIAGGSDIIGVSHDSEIYENIIDTQVTRIGLEYFGAYPSDALNVTHDADHAVGIRCTTGTTNMLIYDNTIIVHSDHNYMGNYSPDGRPIIINARARGFMVGLRYNGQSMHIYGNNVTALDEDGAGYSAGIACDANADNPNFYSSRPPSPDFAPDLVFSYNTVRSNIFNIIVGDIYGPCSGNPLFIQNTLIKVDDYSAYATYGSGLGGYYEGTGRFISNIYQNGAAESSLSMNFQAISNNVPDVGGSYRNKAIIFGDLRGDNYMFYRYQLHNAEGTTGTEAPITVTLNAVGPLFVPSVISNDAIAPAAPSGLNVL